MAKDQVCTTMDVRYRYLLSYWESRSVFCCMHCDVTKLWYMACKVTACSGSRFMMSAYLFSIGSVKAFPYTLLVKCLGSRHPLAHFLTLACHPLIVCALCRKFALMTSSVTI